MMTVSGRSSQRGWPQRSRRSGPAPTRRLRPHQRRPPPRSRVRCCLHRLQQPATRRTPARRDGVEPARRLTTRPPGPSRWHGGSLRAPAAGSSARTPATTSCRSRTRSTSRGDGGLELDDGAVKEMDDWLDGDPGAWLVFSAARDERGERRGAVRARFIAVAAAWSARRSERARRRRVSRRGRQGAVAGGNSEAGGHGRL